MNKRDSKNSPAVLDRRSFLIASAGTIAWFATGDLFRTSQAASLHVLPPLPYAHNALEPAISAGTIGFHYGKHHRGYVDNLNKLTAGTEFADQTLEKIITGTAGRADKSAIFNNAAQV